MRKFCWMKKKLNQIILIFQRIKIEKRKKNIKMN